MNEQNHPTGSTETLCTLLEVERPVLLAPMAKIAGGELAAAVSNAGGLGIVGGGYGDPSWLDEQMALVGSARVGIGLITWNMAAGAISMVLAHSPAAVWLSFGDPAPHLPAIRDAGVVSICQVGSLHEAVAAADAGADVLVAQGAESGGHGRSGRSLFGLLPAISATLPRTPVVAAGGISNRAHYNAAVALGAAGVALGTAFYASNEALDIPAAKQRLVEASGDDTVRSTIYDRVRGPEWPPEYDGRSIRTELTESWAGREVEVQEELPELITRHAAAARDGDVSFRVVWAGEGLDTIDAVRPAAEITRRFPRAVTG